MTTDAAPVASRQAHAADDAVAYPLAVAARKLHKSPRTLKRYYDLGFLPAKLLGPTLMVPASFVEAFGDWAYAPSAAPKRQVA